MTIAGDPIIFPDAVAAVITYYAARPSLTGVPIHQTEPNPLPPTCILVRRYGGHQRNRVIMDAYLTIECWAPTEAEAHDLAQRAYAELYASVGHWLTPTIFCHRVDDVGGLSMSPDIETGGRPRYLWTSSVSLRGATA